MGAHLAGCMPWVATGFSWPPWEKDAPVDGIEGKRRERRNLERERERRQ